MKVKCLRLEIPDGEEESVEQALNSFGNDIYPAKILEVKSCKISKRRKPTVHSGVVVSGRRRIARRLARHKGRRRITTKRWV